jgi:GH15 family glucan-1,4-alpha-glucosidase
MSPLERADAGRAYDYRYAWIRDQAMAGQAAARAGIDDLLDDATAFLRERRLDEAPGETRLHRLRRSSATRG